MRYIDVGDGSGVWATSQVDARLLHAEIFGRRGYGDLDLPPGALVVDVGANIGLFALYVKQRHADAEVIGFEPVPELVEAARRNLADGGHEDVTIHQIALSSRRAEAVPFAYYPLLPSGSTLFPEAQGELADVFAETMPPVVVARMYRPRWLDTDVGVLDDHLPPDRTVDLLKLDVVGSEIDVMDGLAPERWEWVDRVLVDVQDHQGRLGDVVAALERRGFAVRSHPARPDAGDDLNHLVVASRPVTRV